MAAGVNLKDGSVVLWKVSRFVNTEEHCVGLAMLLLGDHGDGGGGAAFIDARDSAEKWAMTAHKLLRQWCRVKPMEATGNALLEASGRDWTSECGNELCRPAHGFL